MFFQTWSYEMSSATSNKQHGHVVYRDHNGVGAMHRLVVAEGDDTAYNPGHIYGLYAPGDIEPNTLVKFQHGPIKEVGINGTTNEALLSILIHRTKILDSEFPCDENKRAIQHLEEALVNLEARTARRMVRGVEGTNQA